MHTHLSLRLNWVDLDNLQFIEMLGLKKTGKIQDYITTFLNVDPLKFNSNLIVIIETQLKINAI